MYIRFLGNGNGYEEVKGFLRGLDEYRQTKSDQTFLVGQRVFTVIPGFYVEFRGCEQDIAQNLEPGDDEKAKIRLAKVKLSLEKVLGSIHIKDIQTNSQVKLENTFIGRRINP